MPTDELEKFDLIRHGQRKLEADLLSLERLTEKSEHLYLRLLERCRGLRRHLEQNGNAYLSERLARLAAMIQKRRRLRGYSQEDFDLLFDQVERIAGLAAFEVLTPVVRMEADRIARRRQKALVRRKRRRYFLFRSGGVGQAIPAGRARLFVTRRRGERYRIRFAGREAVLPATLATGRDGRTRILAVPGPRELNLFGVEEWIGSLYTSPRILRQRLEWPDSGGLPFFRYGDQRYYYQELK